MNSAILIGIIVGVFFAGLAIGVIPNEMEKASVQANIERFDHLDFVAFNEQDWKLFNEIHAADVLVVWPDGRETHGTQEHDIDVEFAFSYAPDLRITDHPITFGQGEWTAGMGIVEGTFSDPMILPDGTVIEPTGKKFKYTMITIAKWEDEQIIEEYLFWDNAEVAKQMGLTMLDEVEETPVEIIPYVPGMEIDFEKELTLLPVSEGGSKALTVTPIIENPKPYPEFYVPGTEELDDNEMRVTMCGTGMPFPVYAQASPCVLVELGNGDEFIFDIGAGSMTRLNNLEIPPAELYKVFIGHLHVDHVGDLDVLWGQGAFAGRLIPLEVYGPDSINHNLGTQYFVDNMLEAYVWDLEARKGAAPTTGMESINVHEFDHKITQVVYEENGVTITAFPAIHGVAGAVSYRLDWNDLSFVYSSDTKPSKWMIENAQEVDILIHEAFAPVEFMVEEVGLDLENAIYVCETIHSPPKFAGIVYELTNPRLAVMYHSILNDKSTPLTFKDLRTTYEGPVVLSQDLTVFNITPEGIVTRQAQITEAVLPHISDEDSESPLSPRLYGELPEWYEEGALDVESLFEELRK